MRHVAVAAACALLLPGFGAAHGGGHKEGFTATVSGIEPPVPGLLATVLGGDRMLSMRNWSGKDVVVLGPDGRPFLRFAAGRVEQRDGAGWKLVKLGTSHAWHESRIHTMDPPPAESGLVKNWQIRGTAGGEPFAIVGFLGYQAPAGAGGDDLPPWVGVAAVAGVVVALAALALMHRRLQGESERESSVTEP